MSTVNALFIDVNSISRRRKNRVVRQECLPQLRVLHCGRGQGRVNGQGGKCTSGLPSGHADCLDAQSGICLVVAGNNTSSSEQPFAVCRNERTSWHGWKNPGRKLLDDYPLVRVVQVKRIECVCYGFLPFSPCEVIGGSDAFQSLDGTAFVDTALKTRILKMQMFKAREALEETIASQQ